MEKNEIERLKSLRILFVEDDDNLRDELSVLFNKLFKETLSASNGQEGLQKLRVRGNRYYPF